MKVAQINIVCNGSTGRIMCQIQKVATDKGIDAISFYGRGNSGISDKFIKIGNQSDVLFHVLLTRLFDKHGHGSKRATKKMIEQLKSFKPDILHLHNIHGYYLNIEALFDYIKSNEIKVVWTLHDCWAFTGHCAYFTFVQCDRWKTGCLNCPQKTNYPSSWFIDDSKKQFDIKHKLFTDVKNLTIVTPSKWLSDLVKQSFLKEYPMKIINNGIDLSIFRPVDGSLMKSKLRIPYNAKVILGVASIWEERKGLKSFIEFAKMIDMETKIVLVGLSKNQIKKLPDNIIGITRTENISELIQLYSMSDVFVNPSIEETFSLATLEAMACGTPIVIFNSTAMTEFVTKDCGEVVSSGNLDQLLKGVRIVFQKSKKYYSSFCISQAQKYNSSDCWNNYIEIYTSNCL